MNDLNIMIVGVGGQGTLLASRIIGSAAIEAGGDVKVSEVHGMSQRGGSVVTYVRLGRRVASPLVDKGQADLIISFELLEALRFLPYLKPGGRIIVNRQQIDPMPVVTGEDEYPRDILKRLREKLGDNLIDLDAAAVAEECGDLRAVNIVLLGVMAGRGIGGIPREIWEKAVAQTVPAKMLEINLKAFNAGYERGSN